MKNSSSHILLTAMMHSNAYNHPVDTIELIETHISWVFLTGQYAYKIKKPVNFGFLDFSTLDKRLHYCEQEQRLNTRLAKILYLDVVSLNNSKHGIRIDGGGTPVEYAVKMRQFPQSCQLDNLVEHNQVNTKLIDSLATTIANFHNNCAVVDNQYEYGDAKIILAAAIQNFDQIKQSNNVSINLYHLEKLLLWTKYHYQHLVDKFVQRKQHAFIRECHGDMHCANITYWNNDILIFDCIEFNKSLRWIDVISDIAFLVMDLEHKNYRAYAWRILNQYLQHTGDYRGIELLRFYLLYRALVRAKVSCIQSQQRLFKSYIQYALRIISPQKPKLIIMHGVSGSAKTTLSQQLLEKLPAIRIRSDIERKRLFQVENNTVLYAKQNTDATYQHMFELAELLLNNNWTIILDATFLHSHFRQQAKQIADKLAIKFVIIHCSADKASLIKRVKQRHYAGVDASDATLDVLQSQHKLQQPLSKNEKLHTINVNTDIKLDIAHLVEKIQAL